MYFMNLAEASTTQPPIIRKSNELIEARYRLSIWEQRLILTLLSNVTSKDEDFKRYKIRVADFMKQWQLNDDSHSLYEKVQDAADSLLTKTIQLSDDPTTSEMVSWLAYVKYKRGSGLVEMEFHASLKPYLLQLRKHFTQYQLNHVINFRNQYSIRIYELLKIRVFRAEDGAFTRSFKYDDLRSLLAIEDGEYAMFWNFKSRVIVPAVEEISANTDLEITDVSYGKTGRKISDITFSVKVKPDNGILPFQLEMEEEPAKEVLHPVVERLINLGFALETAKKYKTRFGVKRIDRNIAYARAKQEAGLVKDLPSFLNSAIKEDMGGAWEVEQAKEEQKKTEMKEHSAKREEQAELAHLKMLAEKGGIPLETLLPKTQKEAIKAA